MWHLPVDADGPAWVERSSFGARVHIPCPLGHTWRDLTRHGALAVAADAELDAADYEAQALLAGPWTSMRERARASYPATITAMRALASDLRHAVADIDKAERVSPHQGWRDLSW